MRLVCVYSYTHIVKEELKQWWLKAVKRGWEKKLKRNQSVHNKRVHGDWMSISRWVQIHGHSSTFVYACAKNSGRNGRFSAVCVCVSARLFDRWVVQLCLYNYVVSVFLLFLSIIFQRIKILHEGRTRTGVPTRVHGFLPTKKLTLEL